MVRLRLLSGGAAGREILARRLPFTVGRSIRADHRLEAPGVWEEHFRVERAPGGLLRVRTLADAITRVNGSAVEEVMVRPGDVIEAGQARLEFWLGPVELAGLRWRERLTWIGLAILVAAQLLLLTRLPG